jgi:hypothetical protein
MRKSVFLLAFCFCLPRILGAIKFDITPHAVTLLSAKHAKWDTVAVESYVYVTGDSAYYNRTNKQLLFLDVRIDSLSAKKHYLKPGDSLETLSGFMVRDTLTVLKTPFALVTWADPFSSFQKEPSIEGMRISTMYFELHPRVDTLKIAGCPVTTALGEAGGSADPALPLKNPESLVPTTVYNLLGRPVWTGLSHLGATPNNLMAPGLYLLSQGASSRIFRAEGSPKGLAENRAQGH